MPSLSEKLKSLGVKVGAKDLPAPLPRSEYSLEQVIEGHSIDAPDGPVFCVETFYPKDYTHGRYPLELQASLNTVAEWAGNQQIGYSPPETLVFLDTETSGLAGGTGTYAFMIGIGYLEQSGYRLIQLFMRDPWEEARVLLALERLLAPCRTIVSFNGKAFDVPLLNTRYTLQGWQSPFVHMAHIDLLPLARRLWRDRLPSRALGNLEVSILDTHRSEEEIPGWMVPQIYFDYLKSGDARPLKNVFYHNAMDVLSLAALLNCVADLLENPPLEHCQYGVDQAALGRLFEDLGKTELASRLFRSSLETDLPPEVFQDTLQRLSFLHKRMGDTSTAMDLWEQAASHQHLYAHVELAKVYEHSLRNYKAAIHWTITAIGLIEHPNFPDLNRRLWLSELQHRLERLLKKLSDESVPNDMKE